MSNNINNLTLENLKWIRDCAIPTSQLRINDENLAKVMRARALILGYPFQPIGCFSCSARSEFKVSQSVLEQYQPAILARISELENEVATIDENVMVVENNMQNSTKTDELLDKPTSKKKKTSVKESWNIKED